MMPIFTYIGVVFSFVGPLLLGRCHFDLFVNLKEMITIVSLSNPVPQYATVTPSLFM